MGNFSLSYSSGVQTSDGQIYTGDVAIAGVLVVSDGSNDATLTLYDGTGTGGKKILAMTATADLVYAGRNFNFPLHCSTGIYADISGTGANFYVEYIPNPMGV